MSDDERSLKVEPGQGQVLKRTYNTSLGTAEEGRVSDTDDSVKEGEDYSPEGVMEKLSIKCKTLPHTPYDTGSE